jgi:hypothetical protein
MLYTTTQQAQLEVGVAIDETRHQLTVGEFQRSNPARRRHARVGTDGGDPPGVVNENGAVVNRRGGYWMDATGSDAKHK